MEKNKSKNGTSKSSTRRSSTHTKCNASKDQNLAKISKQPADAKVGTAVPNDPAWYANSPQLLKDVASLSFSNVLGLDTGLEYASFPLANDPVDDPTRKIPGIMKFVYEPTLGCTEEATGAPTVAARFLYTFVRHANSGSANYEAPDLYMMVVAWASAYSAIMDAQRAYGTMMHYSSYNRYLPKALVTAMGYNYNDLVANMPAFRAAINLAARRLNSIKVPADISLIKRWSQLNSDYYLDANSHKGQIYLAGPRAYMKWEGYESTGGTSLRMVVNSSGKTVAQWIELINSLLDPLTSEEDVGIMSGDIMKAFGDAVTSVPMISEDYITAPILSDEMLTQFHNAITVGDPVTHSIYQRAADGIIIEEFDVETPYVKYISTKPRLLDFYKDNVEPADVMVATRFNPGVGFDMESGYTMLHNTGTEVVTNIYLITDTKEFGSTVSPILYRTQIPITWDDRGTFSLTSLALQSIASVTQFDWAPITYVVCSDSDSENENVADKVYAVIGDVENYTTITPELTGRMNAVAVLSELATMKHLSI